MIRAVIVEDDPMVLEVNKAFLKRAPFIRALAVPAPEKTRWS